jgi:hypothetical protein
MFRNVAVLAACLGMLSLGGCKMFGGGGGDDGGKAKAGGGGGAGGYHYVNQPVMTLVPLHYEGAKNEIWSVNYVLYAKLDRCTPVTINGVSSKSATFTVNSGPHAGQVYSYMFYKDLHEDHFTHLDKIFGPQCKSTAGMSEIDQKGIKNGQVLPGMTKEGVILAVGYPPDHATPDLGSDVWKYWKSRATNTLVRFEGDKVSDPGRW